MALLFIGYHQANIVDNSVDTLFGVSDCDNFAL